jgi:uncharacterized protein YjbI with pentapeptide repeats
VAATSLQSPKPPLIAPLEPLDEMPEDPVFDGVYVQDIGDWPAFDDNHWQIDASKMERCMLNSMTFEHLKIWDAILVRVDLSATRCFEAGLLRSELLGCRMSGAQFGESTIKDVVFENCKLNMVSFRKCYLERVVFRNCVLDEADFIGATLKDVVFTDCELRQTDFNRVRCTRVDMTRADISEIKGVTSLKNVRIRSEQMMTLAPLLCAEVGFMLE